jgi:solute carrier family 7 (L-type amino acid transporter), member 6
MMQPGNYDRGEAEPLNRSHSSEHAAALPILLPRPSEEDGRSTDSGAPRIAGLGAPDHRRPPRSLTFLNGLALVVGIQVGAGIFSSPSAVINNVGSPGLAMLVWLLAGILAWTGAASFIELGSIVPLNGGVQEYLRHIYHEAFGFLAAWTWILVVKPCSVAIVSLIFSEYLNKVLTMLDNDNPSVWTMKGVALLTVVLITYLNCIGTRVSAGTANVFLVLKLLGLTSIIVTGAALLVVRFERGREARRANLVEGGSASEMGEGIWAHIGGYTDATLAALWAYSGWEAVGVLPLLLCSYPYSSS